MEKKVEKKPTKKPAPVAAKPKVVESSKPAAKSEKTKSTSILSHGVGRRKAAIARVWLKRGKGNITVNSRNYENYFDTEITRLNASMPFAVYPQAATFYDIDANIIGGGLAAQADALKLGISRALEVVNSDIRPLLKDHGLLTVDSRVKERKKYGQKAARRKFQFVKR